MTRILIARWSICLTLGINFAALLYAGSVVRNPYTITVGGTGLLIALGIALLFYYDQRQLQQLREHNKLLKGQVADARAALLKQWEQNRHH